MWHPAAKILRWDLRCQGPVEMGSDLPNSIQTAVVLGAQLSLLQPLPSSRGIPWDPMSTFAKAFPQQVFTLDTCSCVPLGTKRLTPKSVAFSSGPPMTAVGRGDHVICVLSRGLCPLDDAFGGAPDIQHRQEQSAPPLHGFRLTESAGTHLKSLPAHEWCTPP